MSKISVAKLMDDCLVYLGKMDYDVVERDYVNCSVAEGVYCREGNLL
jgi:hypothetical protein